MTPIAAAAMLTSTAAGRPSTSGNELASLAKAVSEMVPTPLPPTQYAFTAKTFTEYHGGGATIELKNSTTQIANFNASRTEWVAWITASLPRNTTKQGKCHEYLLLVKTPATANSIYPSVGDRFDLAVLANFMIDGRPVSPGFLSAERINNPYRELGFAQYAGLAAIKVSIPSFFRGNEGRFLDATDLFEPYIAIPSAHPLSQENSVRVMLRLSAFNPTFDAEMDALSFLTRTMRDANEGPSKKSKAAFKYILDFTNPEDNYVDLFAALPHMADPGSGSIKVGTLAESFQSLNMDHQSAFRGLSRIPQGVAMVAGGPGAGKTHWNLLVAAMAMSEKTPSGKRVQVLYLIDMNGPVNDIANRMIQILEKSGMKKKVLRLFSFPNEFRKGPWAKGGPVNQEEEDDTPDFTRGFLTARQVAGLSRNCVESSLCSAPSLDQAAWEQYAANKEDERYSNLTRLLAKLDAEDATVLEIRALRNLVYSLYDDILATADFIATTPVAAAGPRFCEMFQPDLVFLDEAPHARELTTIIPIAWFSPIAWIFTGDYRQTRPFVTGGDCAAALAPGLEPNPYATQLKISTMERAEKLGALKHQLLINHRAYGGLCRLPSKLFYGGYMRPGNEADPPMVQRIRAFLQDLLPEGAKLKENRLLIHMEDALEIKSAHSFHNPSHLKWVMARLLTLIRDANFRSVDGKRQGTVLILTPYKAGVAAYRKAIREQVPPHLWHLVNIQKRSSPGNPEVEVRTIDVAQGHEADVVFVDLVRTNSPGFNDDANRLCVGITRAQQGEIILMHRKMCYRKEGGRGGLLVPTRNLFELWREMAMLNQIVRVKASG